MANMYETIPEKISALRNKQTEVKDFVSDMERKVNKWQVGSLQNFKNGIKQHVKQFQHKERNLHGSCQRHGERTTMNYRRQITIISGDMKADVQKAQNLVLEAQRKKKILRRVKQGGIIIFSVVAVLAIAWRLKRK